MTHSLSGSRCASNDAEQDASLASLPAEERQDLLLTLARNSDDPTVVFLLDTLERATMHVHAEEYQSLVSTSKGSSPQGMRPMRAARQCKEALRRLVSNGTDNEWAAFDNFLDVLGCER